MNQLKLEQNNIHSSARPWDLGRLQSVAFRVVFVRALFSARARSRSESRFGFYVIREFDSFETREALAEKQRTHKVGSQTPEKEAHGKLLINGKLSTVFENPKHSCNKGVKVGSEPEK